MGLETSVKGAIYTAAACLVLVMYIKAFRM